MQSNEVRTRFLKFFEKRGHKIIPSSSLVPENDPSVLFTTAGMQQFKPYYTAPLNAIKDFQTLNISTCQKCVRVVDIDEIGDDTHLTFFEMLGNFSFGGYWKKEAIEYAFDFITKELGLSISYVTIFKGLGSVKKDGESKRIWESLGITDIREEGMEDVFWGPTGNEGPCGPTTEIYCKNAKGHNVEIWNIVFNEYFSNVSYQELLKGPAGKGFLVELQTKGIDTGMGFERLLATIQNKESVFDTDLFEPVIKIIKNKAMHYNEKSARIVADHFRTALFMSSDGVLPSNKDAGYVLRRVIRRCWTHVKVKLGAMLVIEDFLDVLNYYVEIYQDQYPEVLNTKNNKYKIILNELEKFDKTLLEGINELKKFFRKVFDFDPNNIPSGTIIKNNKLRVNGRDVFNLYQTYGLPIEVSQELMTAWGVEFDEQTIKGAQEAFKEHQEKSRTSSAGMFKGGLANHNEKTIKLHTAHHLLLAGLQNVVDKNIKQRGSNITEERLRIDFLCDHKLSEEEKTKVEDWVNEKIKLGLKVVHRELPLLEAQEMGAEMEFGAKYPEIVSVYFIEDEDGNVISKEFCGGPHVKNTGELGRFKILKEEAVAQGIRRIKAVLY